VTTSGGGGVGGGGLADAASDATSEPAWVEQSLVFGERPDVDVAGVTEDTHIESAQALSSLNFGAATGFGPDADPHRAGLLRFDLTSLPSTTVVEKAEIELYVHVCNNCHAEAGTVQVYQLLEDWKEGTQDGQAGSANYWQRLTATPWTTAGAGPGSRGTDVVVDFDPNVQGQAFVAGLPVTLVQQWVTDPAANFGLALESTPSTVDGVVFVSSESTLADQRPVLRLQVLVPQ